MLRDQRFELVDDLGPAAELEVGVDPCLDGRDPPLAEEPDLLLRELLEREIFERIAAPQRERGTQELCALLRGRALGLVDEPVEAREVELLRVGAQHVAGRLELDRARSERLAQSGNVVLQRGGRGLRSLPGPELLDEPVARHGLVRVEQQVGEESSGQPPRQLDRPAVLDDRQRAKDSELHVAFVALSRTAE